MQSTAVLQNFDLTMTSLSSHLLNLSGYVPIWQKDVAYETGEIVKSTLFDHQKYMCNENEHTDLRCSDIAPTHLEDFTSQLSEEELLRQVWVPLTSLEGSLQSNQEASFTQDQQLGQAVNETENYEE